MKTKSEQKIPKVPKPIAGLAMASGGFAQRTYIPELDAAVDDINKLVNDFQKLIELKNMLDVNLKVNNMLDILKEAQEHLKSQDQIGLLLNQQQGFLTNLEAVREYTTNAQHQVDKYNDSNILKKKFI